MTKQIANKLVLALLTTLILFLFLLIFLFLFQFYFESPQMAFSDKVLQKINDINNYSFNLVHLFSLATLKANYQQITQSYAENPILIPVIYFLIYIFVTALSLPGATILSLAGGAVFGFTLGLILVSFASTIGATLAFFTSRFLFSEYIRTKYKKHFVRISNGLLKDGAYYLFILRLTPMVPFFLVNLVMGITEIKPLTFFIVSQIGMLAATAVFVNAGVHLTQVDSLKSILSPSLIFSFSLIGIIPLVLKSLLQKKI